MAGKGCRLAFIIFLVGFAQILMLAFVFLLTGSILYVHESSKERNYAESICRVSSGEYWQEKCKGRRACYRVTWKVQHSGPRFTNATIETNILHSIRKDARQVLEDFPVCSVVST